MGEAFQSNETCGRMATRAARLQPSAASFGGSLEDSPEIGCTPIATPLDRNFSSLIVRAWSDKGRYIPETERAIGLKLGARLVQR